MQKSIDSVVRNVYKCNIVERCSAAIHCRGGKSVGNIYEFRDPVHGFITLNEWERDIINHPSFQRLRRIKQLAWTDMVYPGASHTRFEHSLGVMHVAANLFESLRTRQADLLKELGYENLDRQKQLVRLVALLHDVGHAPFSHAAEDLLPVNPKTGRKFTHEQYSALIIENTMKDVIEGHPVNKKNFSFTIKDLTSFFTQEPVREALVLGDLVSGQMDADRMDYMLRDSLHCGVSYGQYDLRRLISTVRFIRKPDSDGEYCVGVDGDGLHAAEGLIIARYMMFTQVYFHKTRVIYDHHLVEAIREILGPLGGVFPSPETEGGVRDYLNWDDWRICGELCNRATENCKALRNREHFRLIFETPELSEFEDVEFLENVMESLKLKDIYAVRRDSAKSWYKFDNPSSEIFVEFSNGRKDRIIKRMSECSPSVKGLPPVRQSRIYVREADRSAAREIVNGLGR